MVVMLRRSSFHPLFSSPSGECSEVFRQPPFAFLINLKPEFENERCATEEWKAHFYQEFLNG